MLGMTQASLTNTFARMEPVVFEESCFEFMWDPNTGIYTLSKTRPASGDRLEKKLSIKLNDNSWTRLQSYIGNLPKDVFTYVTSSIVLKSEKFCDDEYYIGLFEYNLAKGKIDYNRGFNQNLYCWEKIYPSLIEQFNVKIQQGIHKQTL